MEQYNDDAILALLRSTDQGDRSKALGYLYEKNYPGIARFILSNSGNEADAKDIFQDGLIVFYEKVIHPDFAQTSALKNFLFGICRNLWLKRLRKASQREVSTDDIQEGALVDDTSATELMLEEDELIANLLEQLDEKCQKVLIYFYFERKSMREIAELLGMANDRVAKNKKSRCMEKLREIYERDFAPKKGRS
ncbi:MAG: sigma-70 family RNA polymerase sigma factor [Bacteroidota bacterium]